MAKNELLVIEVAYATPARQVLLKLWVEQGCTLIAAIQKSGILEQFPELDLERQAVGVFSQVRALTAQVRAGDRIEIYRPLLRDPKESRRLRASLARLENLNTLALQRLQKTTPKDQG